MLILSTPTMYSGIYVSFTFMDISWVHLTKSSPSDLISSLLPGFHLSLPLLWSILHTIILNQRMLLICLVSLMVFHGPKSKLQTCYHNYEEPLTFGPCLPSQPCLRPGSLFIVWAPDILSFLFLGYTRVILSWEHWQIPMISPHLLEVKNLRKMESNSFSLNDEDQTTKYQSNIISRAVWIRDSFQMSLAQITSDICYHSLGCCTTFHRLHKQQKYSSHSSRKLRNPRSRYQPIWFQVMALFLQMVTSGFVLI